jgi:hypothetical protein
MNTSRSFRCDEHVINADKLRARIAEEERHFRANLRRIVIDKREHLFTTALKGWSWHDDGTGTRTWAEWSGDLVDALAAADIAWTLEHATPPARWADKVAQFEAGKRWFEELARALGTMLKQDFQGALLTRARQPTAMR